VEWGVDRVRPRGCSICGRGCITSASSSSRRASRSTARERTARSRCVHTCVGGTAYAPQCSPPAVRTPGPSFARSLDWRACHTPSGAVTRRPPISLDTMVPRTEGYAYDVAVWDSSIAQGPFSVAPCQTLTLYVAGDAHPGVAAHVPVRVLRLLHAAAESAGAAGAPGRRARVSAREPAALPAGAGRPHALRREQQRLT
jgi:hypothetical protein